MALDEGQINHSKIKSFKDPKGFEAFEKPDPAERSFDIPAVALVDGEGQQTGTSQTPLNVRSGDIFERIEVQLRIMNLHLAQITEETFTEKDV